MLRKNFGGFTTTTCTEFPPSVTYVNFAITTPMISTNTQLIAMIRISGRKIWIKIPSATAAAKHAMVLKRWFFFFKALAPSPRYSLPYSMRNSIGWYQ